MRGKVISASLKALSITAGAVAARAVISLVKGQILQLVIKRQARAARSEFLLNRKLPKPRAHLHWRATSIKG